MYRYYVEVTDRIYVLRVDSPHEDYLCRRPGAVRITRHEALRLAAVREHVGRGTAWCQRRDEGSSNRLDAAIHTAAAGTAQLLRFYRKLDSFGVPLR